jgi:hypothetical protein
MGVVLAGEVLSLSVVLRVWSHMMERWLLPVYFVQGRYGPAILFLANKKPTEAVTSYRNS